MAFNPYQADIETLDPSSLEDFWSPPPPLTEEQEERLRGNLGVPVFFGNEQTPEQNQFIDNVLALPRGFGKSAARMVAAEIPEGLWALTDLATNLTGFEDALDPKESAFLDRLQEVRDKIGYEESVPGRLGEALGSMAAFVGTSLLTGGAAGALSGAGKAAQAAKLFQTGKLIKAAKASPATFAFMSSPGYMFAAGEQQLRMKARERAGEDIEIGDRNLALALAIPVGISEFIPIGRIFGGMKRADVPAEEFFRYQEILKRGFRNAGEEGLQEAGAGIMQDLIERGIYNPDAAIGETWASEFGYGAGAGGLFSLALNIANRKSRRWGESGDPDDLIKDLPEEELSEVAKQHGLDIPAPDQSEADVLNSELENLESEFEKNIGLETTARLPEIDIRIDEEIAELEMDLGRGDVFLDEQEKGNIKFGRIAKEYRDGNTTIEEFNEREAKATARFEALDTFKKQLAAIISLREAKGIEGEINQDELDKMLEAFTREAEILVNVRSDPDINEAEREMLADEMRKQQGIYTSIYEKLTAFETEKLAEVAEGTTTLEDLTKQ